MRQIIPFKKELLLKTKINEVTSISLEHNLKLKENHSIKGNFIITGDYKMTASSINREKFKFNLPVEIEINEDYDYDNAIVDIDNFYYEIINDDTLKVNIDLYLEANKKEKIIIVEEEKKDEDRININIDSDINIDNNSNTNDMIDEKEEIIEESISYEKPDKIEINEDNSEKDTKEEHKTNLFNTDDLGNDTYASYYVYIVKEEDTIDKILEKFKTTKDKISTYNDISDIKKGTKLIIPIENA